MSVDLDKRLELARLEAGVGDAPTVTWRGREWTLPADLPVEFLSFLDAPHLLPQALGLLLGPDLATIDPPLGLREAMLLAEALPELYGVTLGESKASDESSPSGGTRPRPTSSGTTGSTSRKR